MKPLLLLTAFSLLLGQPGGPAASESGHDARLKRQLEVAKLRFTIDQDGDFRSVFDLPNNRRQTVFISSAVDRVGPLEMREVWAPAYVFAVELDADIARRALRDSDRYGLGAWAVKDWGNESVLVFAAKIPADANPQTLRAAAEIVAGVADAMENDVANGGDAW